MHIYKRKGVDTKRRTTKQRTYKTANTKQRNNKTAKLQNSEEQNSDHNKTANVTKERTFVKNGELTIQNMDNFLLGQFAVFLEVKM